MTEETQAQEAVQQEEQPRAIVVDDVSYAVGDLPDQVQQLIATYDIWNVDMRIAQKEFSQKDSACRFLAGQISEAIKAWAAAQTDESAEEVAEVVPAVESANAALDIPADAPANDVE